MIRFFLELFFAGLVAMVVTFSLVALVVVLTILITGGLY